MLHNEIYIIIYGGILIYSIIIIIQIFLYNYNNKIYIEVEINKYIFSKNNVDLYWIITNCTIIIIITTINHILNKIGIYNSIEYNINYWLIGTGLGLYIAPFVVFGYKLLIYVIDCNMLNINNNSFNKMNDVQIILNGSNYNDSTLIKDVTNILGIYRGIHNIMNWAYQMIYYGVRMWLVFVLHSFSLGSFGELITVITDHNFIFYFGFLGLGIVLYLIVFFYLAIQIYVYISFSLSFLHSTVLLLLYHSLFNHIPHNNNIFHHKSVYLIPVSLVDLFQLHTIFYILLLYISFFVFIPILLTQFNHTYQFIYRYFHSYTI
jgi:hypothetical protein